MTLPILLWQPGAGAAVPTPATAENHNARSMPRVANLTELGAHDDTGFAAQADINAIWVGVEYQGVWKWVEGTVPAVGDGVIESLTGNRWVRERMDLAVPSVSDGILSASASEPVPTSSVTGATAIYLHAYRGDKIAGTHLPSAGLDVWEYQSIPAGCHTKLTAGPLSGFVEGTPSPPIPGVTAVLHMVSSLELLHLCVGMEVSSVAAINDFTGATIVAIAGDEVHVAGGDITSDETLSDLVFKVPADTGFDICWDFLDQVLVKVLWTNLTTREVPLTEYNGVAYSIGGSLGGAVRLIGSACTTSTAGQTEFSFGAGLDAQLLLSTLAFPVLPHWALESSSISVFTSEQGLVTFSLGSALADGSVTAAKLASNAVENAKIADDAVTMAKLANLATDKLIGRVSSGTGDPEAVTCTDLAQSLIAQATAALMRATLGIATAHMSLPRFVSGDGTVSTGTAFSGNTTAHFHRIHVPVEITVNKLTIETSPSFTTASTLDVCLYAEDGQSKALGDVTTPSIAAGNTTYETTVSSVVLPAGDYYVGIVPNGGTAAFALRGWSNIGNSLPSVPSGKYATGWTKAVSAGTLPSTISPGSETESTSLIPAVIRLDT